MKYKWIIFDADDTLFDYEKAESKALQLCFREMGIPFRREYAESYRDINLHIWKKFEKGQITPDRLKIQRFEMLFDGYGIDYDPQMMSDAYLDHLAESRDLIEAAEETLKILSEKSMIAVMTNGLTRVQRPRIGQSLIASYIEHLFISEEIGAAKPGCEIFEFAFERMGKPPKEEVLMVGDSLTSDIAGGNNFGIDVCWFNPKDTVPISGAKIDFQIKRLKQLPDLLIRS